MSTTILLVGGHWLLWQDEKPNDPKEQRKTKKGATYHQVICLSFVNTCTGICQLLLNYEVANTIDLDQ